MLHAQEQWKTTNTGSTAARAIAGSDILIHAVRHNVDGVVRDETVASPDFTGRRALILFPSEQAEVLTPEHGAGDPVTLVVPDGTWTQARRMHHRVPWMRELKHVVLPPTDRVSGYVLRTVSREGGLGTMEAIAQAFGILEGAAVQAELERIFQLLMVRTMSARGTPL